MPAPKQYASSAARQAAYRARCRQRVEQLPDPPPTGAVYRRWEKMREQALSLLEEVVREMETYNNQRSDAWQDSERGQAFLEMMESLADATEALKEIPSKPSEA